MFVWTSNVGSILTHSVYTHLNAPTSIFLARLTRENGDGFVTRARTWYTSTCVILGAWAITKTAQHPGYMKFKVYGIPWWAGQRGRARLGWLYLRGVRLRSRVRWDAARRRLRALAARRKRREVAALLLVTRRLGVRFSERDCGGVVLEF